MTAPRLVRRRPGVSCLLLASSAAVLPTVLPHAAAASTAPASEAAVTPAPAASLPAPTVTEDEIIVTGQAPPGAVIGDIPPENQVSRAEIASYGVDSINDLLSEISDQTTSIEGRDSSSGPVVLVNGKRISGVNEIGDLPVESVLRVDILPEEVAIKYGYDAQQKVVNIILRRRFQSKVVNLSGGMSAQGGGGQTSGAVTYTRIHDNDRFNIVGRVKTQASILESDRNVVPDNTTAITPAGGLSNDSAYRTLQPSTRNYALNASAAHDIGTKTNASLNLRATYSTSDALDGLATGSLTIPSDNPYANGSASTIERYLAAQALRQQVDSSTVSAGGSLNTELSTRWKLSVIASYEHDESITHSDTGFNTAGVQSALNAGDPTIDPYGTLSSSLLGSVLTNRANSNTDTASASMLIFGKLLPLPAGDIGVSLKMGGDFTSQDATTARNGIASSSQSERTDGNARVSIDLPLTSKSKGFLGAIGTLGVNLNGGLTQVSDYGTLGTFGYGLNWTPIKGVTVIAAVNEDRSAPTVANLANPVVSTSNMRVYDYVTGKSVLVTSITGGNPALNADDRHVLKLGVNAQLMSSPKLNFSINYADSRNHNAILSPGGVTAALEAAFPDRYMRDADGTLTQVDARAINVYEERTRQLRWGFNLSAELRKPKRPARPPWASGPNAEAWRARWQARRAQELAAAGGGSAPTGDSSQTGGSADLTAKTAQSGKRPANGSPDGGDDITVTGQRPDEGGAPGFPPGGGPPPDGFGPPPDGFGPPPGGDHGPPPDGFGPPPGGGPGGRRGPGGRGFGGSDNGARLLASLYHTWILRDDVQLTQGGDTLDLLHGGTITGGATPQHKVQGQLGVIDNGLGARFEGTWQSATNVVGDTAASTSGNLHFSSLFTLDFRIFANLQNRFPRKGWAHGTRVSFSVSNIFDARQQVTDSTGATPYAYQPDILDPMGRTLLFSVRRIF